MSIRLKMEMEEVIEKYWGEDKFPITVSTDDKFLTLSGPCGRSIVTFNDMRFSRSEPSLAEIEYAKDFLADWLTKNKSDLLAYLKEKKTYEDANYKSDIEVKTSLGKTSLKVRKDWARAASKPKTQIQIMVSDKFLDLNIKLDIEKKTLPLIHMQVTANKLVDTKAMVQQLLKEVEPEIKQLQAYFEHEKVVNSLYKKISDANCTVVLA